MKGSDREKRRREDTERMSSRWRVLRMSINATSVAWPTSLLNSPKWALLHKFPEVRKTTSLDETYSK